MKRWFSISIKFFPLAAVSTFLAVIGGFTFFGETTCPATAGDGIIYNVHDRGWIKNHSMDAALDSSSCEFCHEREFCNACHFSDNPLERYHESGFVYQHTLDRFIDRAECTSCHDYTDFCAPCHAAAAGRPGDHLGSAWTSADHPEAAREDIERCAGCHSDPYRERVCIQCHQFINPHGTEFEYNLQDSPWDNPGAACYKCHEFGSLVN